MARADRPPTRLARWARVFPLPVPQVATVVAVTVLAGAVAASSVVAAQDEAAQDRAMVRADAAATARLTGQAAQYAAAQDRDAREAALLALDEAQAVLTSAPTFVGEETVEPLDAAVTELTTLVEDLVQAPAPPVIDDGPVSAVADAGSTTTPAPTDDATVALAQDRAEVLDLDSSEDLLAAAERVMALATQVEALSDLVATELADAEEAAAARRAEEDAKRAAAREAAWSRAAAAPNGGIPADLLCRPSFTDVQLLCEAAEALDALNEAHRAELGTDLVLVSGYRTLAQQYDVRATRGGLAARPGTSNHGRGLAVDFAGFGAVGQFDDPDYLWMVDNGPRFGWVHPPAMDPGGSGPLEPWHWEYAGHCATPFPSPRRRRDVAHACRPGLVRGITRSGAQSQGSTRRVTWDDRFWTDQGDGSTTRCGWRQADGGIAGARRTAPVAPLTRAPRTAVPIGRRTDVGCAVPTAPPGCGTAPPAGPGSRSTRSSSPPPSRSRAVR